jgi:sulfatase modifying factor 1
MKSTILAVSLLAVFVAWPAASQKAACPDDMVIAREGVCIDRYEWPNKVGVKPLVYATGLEDDRWNEVNEAALLCAGVRKRVCRKNEWQSACGGRYPYGETFDPTACNTQKRYRKVDEAKVDKYDKKELARLDQSAPAGSYEKCRSPSGAYDMVGNAEEWVLCEEGKYGWCLMGRHWADDRGSCRFVVTKHHPRWHYYSTGFRCCADMKTEN